MGNAPSNEAGTSSNASNEHDESERKLIKQQSEVLRRRQDSLVRAGADLMQSLGEIGGDAGEATNYDHVHKAVMFNLFEAGSLDKGRGVPGVVGLRNLGNSCYLNSSLQCLSNTIPLTEYFLGYDYRSEINENNRLGSGGEIVTAYADLMKRIWLKPAKTMEERRVLVTKGFKKRLSSFAPEFKGDEQHDAHECIATLLDGIHEDLNRIKGIKPFITERDNDGSEDQEGAAVEAWELHLKRDKSPIVDMFQGQLRSVTKCRHCEHKNIRFDVFMYLSLSVSYKCKSLDDALDIFVAPEEMTGDNQWYCAKCEMHVDATKKTDIWVLPPVLIVHLKRFEVDEFGQNGEKIRADMSYPIAGWDLSGRTKSKCGQVTEYELYASANHWGDVDDGHYTAYALNQFDKAWYEFDDNKHEKIDAESTFKTSTAPYVLFFHHASAVSPTNGTSIHRQSVSRPHLWPHLQLKGAEDVEKVRLAKQASTRRNNGSGVKQLKGGKSLSDHLLGTVIEGEQDDVSFMESSHFNESIADGSVARIEATAMKKKKHKVSSSNSVNSKRSSKSVRSKNAKKREKKQQKILIERVSNFDEVQATVLKNFISAGCFKVKGGAPAGVIGLRNLGNTCYINSALQCLSNTEALTEFFLGYDYESEINKNNPLGSGGEFVTAYAELIQKMWLKTSDKKRVVVTQGFKKTISKFATQFEGSHQHDAQEFLATILDGIHEDLNHVSEKKVLDEHIYTGNNDEDDAQESWDSHLERNRSMIVDMFQGQLRNQCECTACGYTSVRFEPFTYLSLPVHDDCESVDDCLDLFLSKEELTRENQWFCIRCACYVDANKKIDLWILPPVMIIHLKRFAFDEYGDEGTKIDTSLDHVVTKWDLTKYVKSDRSCATYYDLYASSNHKGLLDYGHYTTYALNRFNKNWYEFNDNSFKQIDPYDKFTATDAPYMLFYRRAGNSVVDAYIHRQSIGLTRMLASTGNDSMTSDDGLVPLGSMANTKPLMMPALGRRRQSEGILAMGGKMRPRKASVAASSLQPAMRGVFADNLGDEEELGAGDNT